MAEFAKARGGFQGLAAAGALSSAALAVMLGCAARVPALAAPPAAVPTEVPSVIRGRVLDANWRPVGGARVTLNTDGQGRSEPASAAPTAGSPSRSPATPAKGRTPSWPSTPTASTTGSSGSSRACWATAGRASTAGSTRLPTTGSACSRRVPPPGRAAAGPDRRRRVAAGLPGRSARGHRADPTRLLERSP